VIYYFSFHKKKYYFPVCSAPLVLTFQKMQQLFILSFFFYQRNAVVPNQDSGMKKVSKFLLEFKSGKASPHQRELSSREVASEDPEKKQACHARRRTVY
jgi:hypothetical protein